MASDIIIESSHVHEETGHITIRVRTVTTEGNKTWKGPIKGYGCDAAMFKTRFNGDEQQLLDWIASEHKSYHGVHGELVERIHKLKGQKIG